MSWTDERIALLKKMWKEGKSAADIAKVLAKGVTRNAVIGKAHRMGLSGRPSPIKKPPAAKKEPVAAAPKKSAAPVALAPKKAANNSAKPNPLLTKEAEELKKIEKELPKIGGGVALIDLTERMCKWPIGDPKEADFSFCGLTIRQGTPYCPDHAAAAYQTSSRSRSGHQGAIVAVIEEKDTEVEDDAAPDDAEDSEDTED